MIRICAKTGLTALVTIPLAYYLGNTFVCVSFCLISIFIIFSFINKKLRDNNDVRLIAITALLSLFLFTCYTHFVYMPVIREYSGKELNITATIKEAPYKNNSQFYYYIKTSTIKNKDDSVEILLKCNQDLKADVDDEISCTAKLTQSNETYKSKGYFLVALPSSDITVKKANSHSILYYPYMVRKFFENIVSENLSSGSSSICNAVAFGDKANVDSSIKEVFKKSGLQHILVVSGLHLSLISYMILFLFKKLFRKRCIYCSFGIFFVLFYMIMTGLSPSIIRSGVMMIIFIIGEWIYRASDSINSIGVAALILIIENPFSPADVGLMLSFASTIGIIYLSSPIYFFIYDKLKFRNRILKFIFNSISITTSTVIATMPITVLFFKHISLVQIISNLLVQPVFSVLLVSIFIGAILSFTGFSILSVIFFFIAEALSQYVYFVAKVLSLVPISYVNTDTVFFYVWLIINIILIVAVILIKNYRNTIPICILMSTLVFICGFISSYFYYFYNPQLVVYNSGEGICATLSNKGQSAILSCGGDYDHLYVTDNPYENLSEYQIISITSSDSNRCLYAQNFISEFDFKGILIYDNSVICKSKNAIDFSDDYKVKLNGMEISYIVRNNKVYTYSECEGKSVLIMPKNGDCKNIPQKYRTPNIVITDSYCKNSEYISANLMVGCCSEESYSKIMKNNFNTKSVYFTYKGDLKTTLDRW